MIYECGAEGGRDAALLLHDQRVLKRVHQGVGELLRLAGLIEAVDEEILAKRAVLLEAGSAEDNPVEQDCDLFARSHVLGQGDHLVAALAIERDVNRVGVLL